MHERANHPLKMKGDIIFVHVGCLDQEIVAALGAGGNTEPTVIDNSGDNQKTYVITCPDKHGAEIHMTEIHATEIDTIETHDPHGFTIYLYNEHIDPDMDLTNYSTIFTMGSTTPLSDNTVSKLQPGQLEHDESAEEMLYMFSGCWGPFVDFMYTTSPAYFMCQGFKDHAPIDRIKAMYHIVRTSKRLVHEQETIQELIPVAVDNSQCHKGMALIDIGSMGDNIVIRETHAALERHYGYDIITCVSYFRMINDQPRYFVSLQALLTQIDRAEKILKRMHRTEYERIPNETMYHAIGTCYEAIHFGDFWFGPEI